MLAGRDGNRRGVVAVDRVAEAAGLSVGMAVAQALVPGLAVVDADPAGDVAALERLANWALRFSPVVAADPPDELVIDVAGGRGRIQREGEVVYLVVATVTDLSQELASVGRRETTDQQKGNVAGPWSAEPSRQPTKVRDIYIPDLTLEAIRVKARDFR